MLKRKINDNVKINPYSNITATIKAISINGYDYEVRINQRLAKGESQISYYNEKDLDLLEENWNMVKGEKQ